MHTLFVHWLASLSESKQTLSCQLSSRHKSTFVAEDRGGGRGNPIGRRELCEMEVFFFAWRQQRKVMWGFKGHNDISSWALLLCNRIVSVVGRELSQCLNLKNWLWYEYSFLAAFTFQFPSNWNHALSQSYWTFTKLLNMTFAGQHAFQSQLDSLYWNSNPPLFLSPCTSRVYL